MTSLSRWLRSRHPTIVNRGGARARDVMAFAEHVRERVFQATGIRPQVMAEFEDAALMKVMAAEGTGFVPLPMLVMEEAVMRLRLGASGAEKLCALGAIERGRAAPQLHR